MLLLRRQVLLDGLLMLRGILLQGQIVMDRRNLVLAASVALGFLPGVSAAQEPH